MAKIDKDNLGYLGFDFQVRLIAQIITDEKFSTSIIEIIDPNYFEDQYLRIITATIKDAYEKYEVIPDMGSLESRLLEDVRDEIQRKYLISNLRNVQEANLNDTLWVQDTAMKFCKQQELKKSVALINKIIERGDINDYEKCEEILRKALETGDNKDDGTDVTDDIDDVLSDDYRKPIPTGIRGLDEVMDGGLSKGELAIILAPFGVGKEQPNSAKVYTHTGYKRMGDIIVGDCVLGSDGRKQTVTGVFPQGLKDIYKVTFNDGTSTHCGLEHLWAVNSMNQRNRKTRKDGKSIRLPKDENFKVLSTAEIIKNLKVSGNRFLNYRIPTIKPVEFQRKMLTINPYVLGVLLGDGSMMSSIVTTKDEQMVSILDSICDISHRERCRDFESEDTLVVNRCIESVTILGVAEELRRLGLRDKRSADKFIPKDYLYTTYEDRLSLLQGLLDTDGYVSKSGRIQFSTVSKQLADDVRELVLSMGGFCGVKTKIPKFKYKGESKTGKLSYTLTLSFPKEFDIKPFRLDRKTVRVISRDKYSNNKFIKSIELSHTEQATCIMVDNDDHLYVTDDFILTHNTTMMTKIANTAKNLGLNVLQIFFEDNPKVIKRKHLACWSGYDLNDLGLHKEELKELNERKKNELGVLKLKKFPSDGTTIPMIKQYIRKCIAKGFRPDIVLLDYIDCVTPSKKFDDVNVGEGNVMRQFESMLDELNIAGWTAVQGNRSSIRAEVVESDQMGGSIKKGQIGHFVVSIAKSLDQKENGTATMAILKSRFGKDGIIFQDIKFDNASIQIDMGENRGGRSQSEYKKDVEVSHQQRINSVLQAAQLRKVIMSGGTASDANENNVTN